MSVVLIMLLTLTLISVTTEPKAQVVENAPVEISGKPRVIDGDTIEIAGRRIALYGIEAPNPGQRCEADGKGWLCGEEAGFALADMIGRTWVDCIVWQQVSKRPGEIEAICRVGGAKGKDLGQAMVAEGWALADRNAKTDYVALEESARAGSKGIWRGGFIPPRE